MSLISPLRGEQDEVRGVLLEAGLHRLAQLEAVDVGIIQSEITSSGEKLTIAFMPSRPSVAVSTS